MPFAPAIFSNSAITELQALQGRAKVTFPTADSPHFRVERAAKLSKAKFALLAFNQPDDEFSIALLKSYQKISEDAQYIQVALRYETLPGLPLTGIANSFIDLIPPEFKSIEQYTTTTTRIDPSVVTAPDDVSDTILSSTVQMDTAVEGTKTNITRPAGDWPVLTGHIVNSGTLGEQAAVIRTINSDSAADTGFLVITSSAEPLGNGNYLHSTTEFENPPTWPVLTQKSLGGLEYIPSEFRAALSTVETRTKVDPGTDPDPDALSSTVLGSVVIPEGKDRSEKRTTTVTGGYPTLTGHEADPGSLGVSAVVTKHLVADGTAPSLGYQILTSAVQPLGNGLSISTTKSLTWPTLTNQTLGSVDVIPAKFRSAIKLSQVATRVDATGSPVPDALSGTVLESTVTQEGFYLAVKRTTSLATSTIPTLTSHEVSGATLGESAQIVETIVADGTAPATGLKVINSEVSTLGNGYSLSRTLQFDSGTSWPTLAQKQLGDMGLFPERFRHQIVATETRSKVAPSTSPTALSATVFESVVVPETKDRSELRVTELASSSFTALQGSEVTGQTLGEIAYVNESVVPGGGATTADQGLNVVESTVTEMGNGLAVLRTVLIDEDGWPVLTEKQLGGEQLIPAKFLAGLSVSTVKTKVDPSTAPTALSSTIIGSRVIPEGLSRSELQVSTLSSTTLPTLTGRLVSPATWGVSASIVENVYTTGGGSDVAATGIGVLESTVDVLGNGKSLVTTRQLTWPTDGLSEKRLGGRGLIPEKFLAGIVATEVRKKVDPTTAPTALSATVLESEIIPETVDRSESRTVTLSSGALASLIGYEVSNRTLGEIAYVNESIVPGAGATSPDQGLNVVESTITELGGPGVRAVLRTVLIDEDNWPILTEKKLGSLSALPARFQYAAEYDTVISKVAPSTSPTALSSTVVESQVIPETLNRSELRVTSLSGSSASFTNHELNSRGEIVAIAESLVTTGTAMPASTFNTTGLRQDSLGNGQDLLRNETVASFAVLKSYQETGGSAMRQTTVSRTAVSAGLAGVSAGPSGTFPDTDADVLSDAIEQDNLQQIVRRLVRLTDTSGGALGSNPVVTVPLEYDKRTNVQIFRQYKLVAAGATLPTIGSVYPSASSTYVIDARLSPLGEAPYFGVNAVQEIEYCAIPAPWVEFPMVGYEFPALFKFANNYSINSIAAFYSGFPPPWPGDGTTLGTYQLVAHRQAVRQARRVHTYHLGPSNALPVAFKVITPGVSSGFFRIPANCIHQAINITGTSTVGSVTATYPIETIPASNPSAYSATQILVHSCEERRIMGNIFERIITEISEDASPDQFGPIGASVSFASTSQPQILAQPDSAGEILWLKSSNAGDTQACIVYGRRGSTVIRERVTLTGTTFVATTHRFQRLYHLHVGSAPAGDVTIYGSGIPKAGLLDFSLATMADGDTVEVGRTGATQVYQFKTTMAAGNDVQLVAGDIPASLANLALAVSLTGLAGSTTSGANYFTGTAATADIVASIDDGDSTVIHFADSTALQTNSNTYVLTPVFAGTAPTAAAFGGDADGPVLATVTHADGLLGKIDAYQVEYLNNPGLLTDIEAPAIAGVPQSVVSASSDGSSTVVNNLPATVTLTTDGLAVPPSASAYSLILCLAGTPSLTPTYETSADNSTWVAGTTTPLPTIGNGKVFTVQIAEATPAYIRMKFNNTGSNLARAVHAALAYEVPQ